MTLQATWPPHVGDDGAVSKQVAFDPYGRPEKGGTGKSATAPGSSLGFQGAHTDPTTGSVILGPRQYDPTTTRFTSPDVYASGDLDLGLGTDELTGNRYLFAAANPVTYYEDGHKPGLCRRFWNCKRKGKSETRGNVPSQSELCAPTASVGPVACALALNYRNWALRTAAKYGKTKGEINAPQHSLWAAIVTWDWGIGEFRARQLLRAHEVGVPRDADYDADEKNNPIGIAIGKSEPFWQSTRSAMRSILRKSLRALRVGGEYGALDLSGG
jgi:RHS repeat-associated protein